MEYDVFISYLRSSYDTANLIATRLKAAGYSVFFDMETLHAGKFNKQLFNVIDNCKDFSTEGFGPLCQRGSLH